MPKRPSKSVRLRGVARAASRLRKDRGTTAAVEDWGPWCPSEDVRCSPCAPACGEVLVESTSTAGSASQAPCWARRGEACRRGLQKLHAIAHLLGSHDL